MYCDEICGENVDECSHVQKVHRLQQELQQYKASQHCLKMEIAQMKRAVERMEQERQEIHAEKHHIREELDCVLSMCAQLKANKDKLCCVLEERDVDIARMQTDKRELILRLDEICTQLKNERDHMKQMDAIIDNRRQRDHMSQGSVQNLIQELKCAHKELCSAEKKLSNVCQGLKFLESPPPCMDEDFVEYNQCTDYVSWVPICQGNCQERRNKELEKCIEVLAELVRKGCRADTCNPMNIHQCYNSIGICKNIAEPCKKKGNPVMRCPSDEKTKQGQVPPCVSSLSDSSKSSDKAIKGNSPVEQNY